MVLKAGTWCVEVGEDDNESQCGDHHGGHGGVIESILMPCVGFFLQLS